MAESLESQHSAGIVEKEDPSEEMMEIEEIEVEPLNSKRIRRCGKCRRVQFGHPVPYGIDKCKLERIDDDKLLAEDDKKKLELRRDKRGKKRSRSREYDGRRTKFSKEENKNLDELVAEGENIKEKLRKQKEETRKEEEDRANQMKKLADDNRKAKEELDREHRKTADIRGGAKSRNLFRNRDRRSRSKDRNKEERRESDRRKRSPRKDY